MVPQSPNDVTLDLASNLVTAQKLNYSMTLSPAKAATQTSTSLGPIGILVNGAVIFNPYKCDGKIVAVTGNVFLTDASGTTWRGNGIHAGNGLRTSTWRTNPNSFYNSISVADVYNAL